MRLRTIAVCLTATGFLVSFDSSTAIAQIRVSGAEMDERIIDRVDPRYPPQARQERIQGRVELDIVIDDLGEVAELEVATGHPLLADAAAVAVWQWLYEPYTVDGLPVEVATTVNVTFALNPNPGLPPPRP